MNWAIAFVGFIDLFLCAVVFKITFASDSKQKMVIDKKSRKVYMIQNIKHRGLSESDIVEGEDEERDEDDERDRVD